MEEAAQARDDDAAVRNDGEMTRDPAADVAASEAETAADVVARTNAMMAAFEPPGSGAAAETPQAPAAPPAAVPGTRETAADAVARAQAMMQAHAADVRAHGRREGCNGNRL